jgi:hypothetical protein
MSRRGAFNVKKFWVSGISPVAADLASAASAPPPSGAVVAGAEDEELELAEVEEPLPHPQASSKAAVRRNGDVILGMRISVPQGT